MLVDRTARGATAARSVAALVVDRPIGARRHERLRQRPGDAALPRLIEVTRARPGPGWTEDLDELAAASGTGARPFACTPELAARTVDDGETLLVLRGAEGGRAAVTRP